MTETYRQVPGQRADVRRPGIVYGVPVLDPVTREVLTDYVGKTRQQLLSRERQHRDERPFSDLIVGDAFVIEQGMWTDTELDERELFHIARLRPRMNHDDNLDNPARIPIWRQRQDRDARDRAKGMTPRPWPAPRVDSVTPARQAKRRRLSPWWRRRRNWAVGLAVGWLVAAAVLWLAAAHWAVPAPWRTWPIAAAALTAVVPVWRIRRKRDRELAVAAITVACAALWLVTG